MDPIWGIPIAAAVIVAFAAVSLIRSPRRAAPLPQETVCAPDPLEKSHFFLRAQGVDHYQAELRECAVGEQVILIPEPGGHSGIKICRLNGGHIGYVPGEHSARLSKELSSGWQYRVTIETIYPFRDRSGFGCRLRLGVLRHGARPQERERHKVASDANAI